MLHSENRQGGEEDHRAVAVFSPFLVLLLAVMMVSGCGNGQDANALSEQRERQYALNSRLLSESLGQFISNDKDSIAADNALRSYYSDSTNVRLWTPELMPTIQADSLLRVLEHSIVRAGFSIKSFRINQIREDIDSLLPVNTDSLQPTHIERLARLEYLLSKAYLHYTRGQRFGFVDNPEKLLNRAQEACVASDQHIEVPSADFATQTLKEAANGNAIGFLLKCEPTADLYRQLEQKLAETTESTARQRLIANMERERWHHTNRPRNDEKYVLVNVAAQQLWAVNPDTVLQMRVVCGARRTKTPLMQGRLNRVIVNPYWYIPAKLVRDEISPHGGDSAYFARHHYFITNSDNDTLNPRHVSREQLAANHYRVTQHRGAGNALGRLKFNFDNSYSVYLHDTNTPNTFQRADRALSHGCVRVQRPYDLACFLLNLDEEADKETLDKLRVAIGQQPKGDKEKEWLEQNGDDPKAVLNRFPNKAVSPNVPVYIIYYTIYPNPEDNMLQTWGDPYGYDTLLLKALKPFM